jgi:hypothetical protein
MGTVEPIGRIRRVFWVDHKPIRQFVRELRFRRRRFARRSEDRRPSCITNAKFSCSRGWGPLSGGSIDYWKPTASGQRASS